MWQVKVQKGGTKIVGLKTTRGQCEGPGNLGDGGETEDSEQGTPRKQKQNQETNLSFPRSGQLGELPSPPPWPAETASFLQLMK